MKTISAWTHPDVLLFMLNSEKICSCQKLLVMKIIAARYPPYVWIWETLTLIERWQSAMIYYLDVCC